MKKVKALCLSKWILLLFIILTLSENQVSAQWLKKGYLFLPIGKDTVYVAYNRDGRIIDNLSNASSYKVCFRQDGIWKFSSYYDNGTYMSSGEQKYPEGGVESQIGKVAEYYENGRLKIVGNRDDKGWQGTVKEFFDSGKLKSSIIYKDNEQLIGSKAFFSNGKLRFISGPADKFGDECFILFTSSGKKRLQIFRSKLDSISLFEYLHPNGEVSRMFKRQTYTDYKIGTDVIYDTNGAVRIMTYFDDLLLEKEVEENVVKERTVRALFYDENESELGKIYYLDKKAHGEVKFYHKNGKLRLKGQYVNGLRSGLWNEYNEKGKLIQSAEYLEDVLHGHWLIYNESGKVQLKRRMQDGKVIWIKGKDSEGNVYRDNKGVQCFRIFGYENIKQYIERNLSIPEKHYTNDFMTFHMEVDELKNGKIEVMRSSNKVIDSLLVKLFHNVQFISGLRLGEKTLVKNDYMLKIRGGKVEVTEGVPYLIEKQKPFKYDFPLIFQELHGGRMLPLSIEHYGSEKRREIVEVEIEIKPSGILSEIRYPYVSMGTMERYYIEKSIFELNFKLIPGIDEYGDPTSYWVTLYIPLLIN